MRKSAKERGKGASYWMRWFSLSDRLPNDSIEGRTGEHATVIESSLDGWNHAAAEAWVTASKCWGIPFCDSGEAVRLMPQSRQAADTTQ